MTSPPRLLAVIPRVRSRTPGSNLQLVPWLSGKLQVRSRPPQWRPLRLPVPDRPMGTRQGRPAGRVAVTAMVLRTALETETVKVTGMARATEADRCYVYAQPPRLMTWRAG